MVRGSMRAQTAPSYPSISTEDLTTYSIYQRLFEDAVSFQRGIDEFESKGVVGRGALHAVKFVTSLTDSEDATLIAVAKATEDAIRPNLQTVTRLVVQFRSNAPTTVPYPPALVQQVTELKNKSIATVFAAIQQLKTAFGPARFQNLDHYVRTTIADQITKTGISLTPPALPPRP